ncbi:hypothetical protein ACJIZ3_010241 [Penstemon smallii]|uniref:Uncharacterized protein n=1 Tax=Penstemon smallii TaxID=265156 RepID=A0ABD3TES8_9LAMI
MSSLQPKSSPNPNSNFNEKQWVIHIRQTLEEEIEEETEIPVSIFTVPKPLMAIHPDSYIPQQVSIGPNHHTRPELHDMERYKLAAAKGNQREFQNIKLHHLVDCLVLFEPKIRASYHKYLTFSGETLAWMMALDASFLLEFLQVCAVKQGKATTSVITSRLSHLVGLGGNKAAHNAILRDIVMVENQIPLLVLRKLLELHFSSSEKAEEMLFSMLFGLCEELSPFKTLESSNNLIQVKESPHLLDFFYHFLVPKLEICSYRTESIEVELREEDEETSFLYKVWTILSKLATLIKKIIFSKPVKVIVKLPWTILSNIPLIKIIKEPVESFLKSLGDDEETKENNTTDRGITNKSPLLEEIAIPSVTQLVKSGVRFNPTNEGISSITFDNNSFTLNLPTINLDMNSEVVLRNLVAYEACNKSGPLVLARYIELMNGIIDTEEDAKFLREKGIIVNRLKSDIEVANLWNGMSKSIRLTKVPFLDKVIEDVNKFYSGRLKVKFRKCMKRYVFESWRVLTLLAAVLMIFFMGLQAFCTVYNCARVLPIDHLN